MHISNAASRKRHCYCCCSFICQEGKNACVPSCHNFSWMAEFPPFHCDKLDYIHYSAILWGFLCAKNLRHSNPSSELSLSFSALWSKYNLFAFFPPFILFNMCGQQVNSIRCSLLHSALRKVKLLSRRETFLRLVSNTVLHIRI